jgi:hypothetical protein
VSRVRVRFGLRLPTFKNAGVFVFYTTEDAALDLRNGLVKVKSLLTFAGQPQIGDRLICEYELV